ncbi:MAG TPA: hypothetical protein VGD95_07005, partial [Micavibrio sp.]
MRLATVGKGGSGKTTLASLLAALLAARQQTVCAIDADINQTLGSVLGIDEGILRALPGLGAAPAFLKNYLRGSRDLAHVVKTTLPGPDSALLSLDPAHPVMRHYAHQHQGILLMQAGGFDDQDIGTHCYHSKTGMVELWLNHLLDGADEFVIVDMTAGADAFASGLFTRFDLTLLVVEPTRQSVSVYQQYKQYAAAYDLNIRVVGNKVADARDEEFIRAHCGADVIGCLRPCALVKARDRGEEAPLSLLEPHNRAVLEDIIHILCAQRRDWARYWEQAIEFHLKNAESWANAYTGTDLSRQIQREYLKKLAA